MAKLILKANYYKPGRTKSMGSYVKYVATRENVEKIEDQPLHLQATEKQDELIAKLVKDFPGSVHNEEYLIYKNDPTQANASEYITRTLEDNLSHIVDSPTYADYIATRPRAERIGSHGLFSLGDEPIVLSKVSEELNKHQGNVWVFIASLKREDAERLGFDNASRWKDMIGSNFAEMAKAMKIAPENLKWYAAFHNEGHHPHVHIMAYSTNPNEGYLNHYGIDKIRSVFAQDIFAQDLKSVYEDQTELRQRLKEIANELIKEILDRADAQDFESTPIEQKLVLLAEKLKKTKGKKVYGYMSKDIKDLVDSIVDELAKDKTIADLYDLWYEKKYEILGMYSSRRPPMIPLSENKEFRSIKNSIINEAKHINEDPSIKLNHSHTLKRVSATAVTRLFKNVCNIFRGKLDDENRRTIYTPAVDKQIRREDEAKRNAEILYD